MSNTYQTEKLLKQDRIHTTERGSRFFIKGKWDGGWGERIR